MKVLFVWEFGGHLGHILNMLPLARELHGRGFGIAFALKDLARANIIFDSFPQFRIFQAPTWKVRPQDIAQAPQNLAQVLQRHGYKSAGAVEAMARAWISIYDSVAPDLVVYDYAFTAQLAYRGLPAKQVTLGSGFFSPAFDQHTPAFEPGTVPAAQLQLDDDAVLAVINRVCHKLKKQGVAYISDLNKLDGNFLSTMPELDHYGERAGFQYIGPVTEAAEFQSVQWGKPQGQKRIFGYLKPSALSERLLHVLAGTGHEVHIFMPGLTKELRQRYVSTKLKFSIKPFDMEHAAKTADLALCHAGHGTVASLLLYGCPVLLLPQQAEQWLLAKRIDHLGAGETLEADADIQVIKNKLDELLHNPEYRENACLFANKYSAFQNGSPIKKLADSLMVVLGTGNAS